MILTLSQIAPPAISVSATDPPAISITDRAPLSVTISTPGSVDWSAGRDVATLIYEQVIAQAIWTITHNLGRYPAISVVDSAGSLIDGDVSYRDANTIVLTFAAGFAGRAFLN